MKVLEKKIRSVNKVFVWIAGFFLAAITVLTCADIVLRLVWRPILGAVELSAFFGAVVTAFSLGYTQMMKGHVVVDIFVERFPKKTRRVLNMISYLICMIFFALLAWQISKHATNLWRTREITETLRIAFYPFVYAVAIGCIILSLVLLKDLLNTLLREKEGEK